MSDLNLGSNQASGNSNPSGTHEENTFQSNQVKQLVYLVRYKPAPPSSAPFDTSGASSMLSSVTGAAEGAASAAEGAMASIPGLGDMFIKEEPKKSGSETEYTYYKDYSGWDSVFNKFNSGFKEMNTDNITDTFEFNSTDADGRKKDAQQLFQKIQSKTSAWSKYTAKINFIGVGQGGNVVNECCNLLAKDGQFKSEKWNVQTVIYVATPLYKNLHAIDKSCFKDKGGTFSFSNPYDLTQGAIECFDKNDKLLKLIADSNKNTLSLAVGKVKLRVIEVLAIILSGLNISSGDQSQLNKFGKVKDEVQGMVEDVIGLVKKIITEGAGFIKLGDLPEFSKMVSGYDQIPGKVSDKLGDFIDSFTKKVGNQAKSADMSLSPADLAGVLTCLCPLFDTITASMSVFEYNSKTSIDLAKQIIDEAGVTKVYVPADAGGDTLQVDQEYANKVVQAAKDGKPDKAAAYVKKIQELIHKAADRQEDASKMNDEEKQALAEAIGCIVQPMLASKKELYQKLLDKVPFDIPKLVHDYTTDKLMSIPGGALSKLNIAFPDELNKSIAGTDGEIKRITGYFDKNNFDTQEDTLYYIYNEANLVFKKMYGPIAHRLDMQTGYLDYMKQKGFDNSYDIAENKYTQGAKQEKTDVKPAKKLV